MMTTVVIASLSEGWGEAQPNTTTVVLWTIYFAAMGPFWAMFAGGTRTLLGVLWLMGDIMIVVGVASVTRKILSRHEDSDTPRGYFKACLAGTALLTLPIVTWVVVNYVITVAWNYFDRS